MKVPRKIFLMSIFSTMFLSQPPVHNAAAAAACVVAPTEASIISISGSIHQVGVAQGALSDLVRTNSTAEFTAFVIEIDAFLRDLVATRLCSSGTTSALIKLTLLEFPFVTDDRGRSVAELRLDTMSGSYAEAKFDKSKRTLSATVVWNPRRMLRDQLILKKKPTDVDKSAPPFTEQAFDSAIEAYAGRIIGLSPQEATTARRELEPLTSEDLYAILSISPQTTRVPFDTSVRATMKSFVTSSRAGYTAATKIAILRALDGGTPVKTISDIHDPKVHALFK